MAFKFNRSMGMMALAAWLILFGFAAMAPTITLPAVVMGVLAIAAGVLILVGR